MSLTFYCTAPVPSQIYTLSLHDALPISLGELGGLAEGAVGAGERAEGEQAELVCDLVPGGAGGALGTTWNKIADEDRKSTRLNSSHVSISYAVFCLKKKKTRSGRRRSAR